MFGLIWAVTARTHFALRRFMPTNIVLDAIHTRPGLKWGLPAMLLGIPYALAAVFCAGLVEAGGASWLNLLALLFVGNALKLLLAGPVTVIRLLRVRGREAKTRRRAAPAVLRKGDVPERVEEPVLTSTLSSRRG
jgi:hypothetical protein